MQQLPFFKHKYNRQQHNGTKPFIKYYCKDHRESLYSSKGKIVYVVGKPCNIYRFWGNPIVERFKCNFIIWFDSVWSNQGCLKLAECNWLMCDDSNLMALVEVIYYGDWQQNRYKISRFHPLFTYLCSLLNNKKFSRQQNVTKLQ